MTETPLDSLEQQLGYAFADTSLLVTALTHRSFGASHNERLEFLGDAVLDLLVGECLFRHYPLASEGELTHWRSGIVCGQTLAGIARELGLGACLYLGTGEERSGGRDRDSILADALEALLAAIYLDGGMTACRDVVLRLFESVLASASSGQAKDAKTCLQEYLQARQMPLPEYRLLCRSGNDHEASFSMACVVTGLAKSGEATASSRKKAEQLAAAAVLAQLGVQA